MEGEAGMDKRLRRSSSDRMIAGVCGGLGKYLDVDPVIIRLLWAVAIFIYGTGLLAYIIAWVIIPEE
jgi:phage shock protein PspC (stress-responsive transcriptional regulator)